MSLTDASLPSAYAHFAPLFERLSDHLRDAVAGQLAQFEQLVELIDEPAISSRGEMTGLGSLTRHGDLSNILQSELLLRTEAPLEFLRRIAEAETLYHEKEYRDDGSKRVLRLMISVGPGTLGHGRIFSLAALFLLARVASQRGEALHWCYLPNATGPIWFEEISVNTIKRLLKTASYREMTVDDVAEAREKWSEINTPARTTSRTETVDWVVGARDGDQRPQRHCAASQMPRSIGFRLEHFEELKPRTAQLFVRRSGKDARPLSFTFPNDNVCLSALNKPFAPIKPDGFPVPAITPTLERLEHWAPRYISAPGAKTKFVRMEGGVLVLFNPKDQGFEGSYFIPVPTGTFIAGLRLKEKTLYLLLHDATDGVEKLTFATIGFDAFGQQANMMQLHQKALPSAQLFRTQHPYALPLLAGHAQGPEFHATNGKAFSLSFDQDGEIRFAADRDAAAVIFANGQHRLVRTTSGETPILRTLRANNSSVHDFSLDNAGFDEKRLRAVLYSAMHGQVSFSVMPNIWALPAQCHISHRGDLRLSNEPLQCEFASYEIPLSIQRTDLGIRATIWSDARRGGEGGARTLEIRGERVSARQKLFDISTSQDAVAEMIMADDGVWSVDADANGVPVTLHHYIARKRGNGPQLQSHRLDDLRGAAVHVSVER